MLKRFRKAAYISDEVLNQSRLSTDDLIMNTKYKVAAEIATEIVETALVSKELYGPGGDVKGHTCISIDIWIGAPDELAHLIKEKAKEMIKNGSFVL